MNESNDQLPDQIIDKLYLGCMFCAGNLNGLDKLNISHILIAAQYLEPSFPDKFTYKKISVNDSPEENIKKHFNETHKFINEGLKKGTGVLIHCAAGISRSSTCTIAYLMKEKRMTFEEAYKLVKSKHSQTMPNTGFIQQLKVYENELNNSSYNKVIFD